MKSHSLHRAFPQKEKRKQRVTPWANKKRSGGERTRNNWGRTESESAFSRRNPEKREIEDQRWIRQPLKRGRILAHWVKGGEEKEKGGKGSGEGVPAGEEETEKTTLKLVRRGSTERKRRRRGYKALRTKKPRAT